MNRSVAAASSAIAFGLLSACGGVIVTADDGLASDSGADAREGGPALDATADATLPLLDGGDPGTPDAARHSDAAGDAMVRGADGGGPIDASSAGTECHINGVTYQAGAPDPSDPCELCDPSVSLSSWTPLDDGSTLTVGTCCGGSLVDVATSGEHCNRCGHSCQGGACSNGACQPVLLASGLGQPWALALDRTSLYWTDAILGTVMKVNLDGGGLATLVSGQVNPLGIAVSGQRIYWSRQPADGGRSGEIATMTLDGGSVTLLAGTLEEPGALKVDDSNVYWIDDFASGGTSDASVVVRLPRDGGAPVTFGSGPLGGWVGALTATDLYWSNGGAPGVLARTSLDGGALTTIASGQSGPTGVAVQGSHVYWLDDYAGLLTQADLDGSRAAVLSSGNGLRYLGSLAVDDTGAYFSAFPSNTPWQGYMDASTSLLATDLDSGVTTTVVTGLHVDLSIVVDRTTIYWAGSGGSVFPDASAVMKVAKP